MSSARLLLLSAAAVGLAAVLWIDKFGKSAEPISSLIKTRDTVELDVGQRTTSTNDSARQFEASPIDDSSLTTPAPLSAMVQLDPDRFAGILDRPLFSTTRRPHVPKLKPKPKRVIVKKSPPREPPLRVRLVGIVKGNGRRIALLRDPGSSKTIRLSTGDKIHGWQIEKIGDSTVRVRHKSWTRELTLFRR